MLTTFSFLRNLVAILALALIYGCAMTPAPAITPRPSPAYATPHDIDVIFNEVRQWVATETGTDLDDVRLLVTSPETISVEAAFLGNDLIHRQFHSRDYAHRIAQKMSQGSALSYLALYTNRGPSILLNEEMLFHWLQNLPVDSSRTHALQALLTHELVHAADDKRYVIHENKNVSFKDSFSKSAVYEGHAQLLARRLCTRHGCLQGLSDLEKFMFREMESTPESADPSQVLGLNVLEYAYIEGEQFLHALEQREDGENLLESALQNPPPDPVQILSPDSYPNVSRYQRNDALSAVLMQSSRHWNDANPWTLVETSALRGLNVRKNPSRRQAAIDGFTRLITAMSAAQLYDESADHVDPMDIMLIETQSDEVADLFARSFTHRNLTDDEGIEITEFKRHIPLQPVSSQQANFRAVHISYPLLTSAYSPQGKKGFVLVATLGRHVVQLSAHRHHDSQKLVDFSERILTACQSGAI